MGATRSCQLGFTLMEVLVALAVLAIALGAAVQGAGLAASTSEHLRDRTFAQWVALNRIAEVQLAPAWPAIQRQQGKARLAERDWYWSSQVEATSDGDMRRLLVSVGTAPDHSLVELTAWLARPAVDR